MLLSEAQQSYQQILVILAEATPREATTKGVAKRHYLAWRQGRKNDMRDRQISTRMGSQKEKKLSQDKLNRVAVNRKPHLHRKENEEWNVLILT